jgi:hypothetical protein
VGKEGTFSGRQNCRSGRGALLAPRRALDFSPAKRGIFLRAIAARIWENRVSRVDYLIDLFFIVAVLAIWLSVRYR